MNKKEEEFMTQLLTTFKIEADEHIKALNNGLMSLEQKLPQKKQKEIVETIFREAHSLKGAARSVSFDVIQTICQTLEDVLEGLKNEKLALSPELFDTVYAAVDLINKFIVGEVNSNDQALLEPVIVRMQSLKDGPVPAPAPAPAATVEPPKEEAKVKPPKVAKEKAPKKAVKKSAEEVEELLEKRIEKPKTEVPAPPAPIVKSTPPPQQPAETPASAHGSGERTIRIFASKLDRLLQNVEETLIIKLTSSQRSQEIKSMQALFRQWEKEWGKVQSEVNLHRHSLKSAENQFLKDFRSEKELFGFLSWQETFFKTFKDRLNKLAKYTAQDQRVAGSMIDTLLDETKKVLMQPFSTLLEAFPRMVRDISHKLGKEVRFNVEGTDIEIDKRILEEIKDPLLHIIRNSIDHGIELPEERAKKGKPREGTLLVKVNQISGSSIEVIVSDDGKGINVDELKKASVKKGIIGEKEAELLSDHEALMLIYQSGVSTSPIITELSGRGIGMGVVSEKVEKLGGKIQVETLPDQGTIFSIILPSTLATFRGIHIRVAEHDYIIPTNSVKRIVRIKAQDIKTVENRETISMDGKAISLVSLADLLNIPRRNNEKTDQTFSLALLLKVAETVVAFKIDNVLNEQEVFVKGLGKQLSKVKNISAATVMEWGKVVPILDPFDLIKSIIQTPSIHAAVQTEEEVSTKTKTVLVVEDSVTARMLLKNIMESAGFEVKTAIDGVEGYNIINKEHVDLMLTDVEMPNMDGFTLTEKVRATEKIKDIPIVICTSRGSKEDREHGIEVGANAYIDKSSFVQSNLLDIVKKLL